MRFPTKLDRVTHFVIFAAVLLIDSKIQSQEIEGWGTVINPDNDCKIKIANDSITFTLPEQKHDLWYGGKNPATRFNSPRVMQPVTGNFVATVRVTAYWDRGIVDGGYNGAGLVVWESEKQYLRLERNRMNNGRGTFTYTTPLYDQDNRRVFYISTEDEFFKGHSTWLRITRFNSVMVTDISNDGKSWTRTGVITTEFPETVQVGIHAVNSTGKVFSVLYDKFSITK